MFRKTIAVLLVFSIALSSCGKKDKDKSNDFLRVAPVESEIPDESFEYLEYPELPESRVPVKSSDSPESPETPASAESRVPVKSSTPVATPTSTICDGFALCRSVRDSTFMHYCTYDMFHIYGVPVTPNRVVWALVVVCAFRFGYVQFYSFLDLREEREFLARTRPSVF